MPRTYGSPDAADTHDKPWTTGFFKEQVDGPVQVVSTGLVGDAQADLKHHGGPDKAILAYAADHYPLWKAELGIDMPHGGFGENLTVHGADETTLCIGDVFTIGNVIVEISQPRQPCWKLARRWRNNALIQHVIRNGRTGWYLRVIQGGFINPGTTCMLMERKHPAWTIARANTVMHHEKTNAALLAELAACPSLAIEWQKELREKIVRMGAA